jgi:hypothetical protein
MLNCCQDYCDTPTQCEACGCARENECPVCHEEMEVVLRHYIGPYAVPTSYECRHCRDAEPWERR